MRLEEEFVGRKLQFAQLLKRVANELEADTLHVRGKKITMPEKDMEFKISTKSDYGASKLAIQIEWLE